MFNNVDSIFTTNQLAILKSIIQVGDETYRELVESNTPLLSHKFFGDTRSRIRTKIMQIQCELESHEPNFPFKYFQRIFPFNQIIPELRTKKVILHIGQTHNISKLPHIATYKKKLSLNNNFLQRQLIFDFNNPPSGTNLQQYYAILAFDGTKQTFSLIQFPEPGYKKVAQTILLPQNNLQNAINKPEIIERKKAVLKKELIAHISEEEIS